MSRFLLSLVFVCCFTLATYLAPIFEKMKAQVETSGSPLAALVGESREMFANQFFSMADVYFHSGYYPTIFDGSKKEGPSHLDVASHDESSETNAPPDDDENFLGKPKDWIDRFGRNFFPTVHTHLGGHHAEEILPWLKLSAEMDPKHIDTYVTAAYWLRTSLNKPNEAEEFLREGLRENPDSAEILLELGRIYFYNRKEPPMARNLWEIALAKWTQQEQAGQNPDRHVHEEILGELVRDDDQRGDLKQELVDLQELSRISPGRISIQKAIEDVKAKLAH